MPIQYNRPISMYVDKNSAKISETLRDRFASNFATQDAIQDKMISMNVAPFKKDQEIKNNLDKQTRGELESYANRGDYENLSLPIARTARKFSNTAQALEKNSQAYAGYKQQLDKLYEDEKIDSEDYQGALFLSSQNYSGLDIDADGRASEYFSGIQAIQNPDIPKMIKDTLKGIVPDEYENISRVVGQGPNGELEIETSEGIKTVPADRVQEVMKMVMGDPRVKSYLGRKAQIRTSMMSDEDLIGSVQNDINAVGQTITQIDARLSKNISNNERAQLEKAKADLMQNVGNLGGIVQSGNIEAIREEAAKMEFNKINAMYNTSAENRYSYKQTKSAAKQWWDDMYKQKDQQSFDVDVAHSPIIFESNVMSVKNPFGSNDLEASEIRGEKVSMYNAVAEELDSMGDNVTPELMDEYMGRIRNFGRDIKAFDDYTMYRYQATNPKLFNSQQYKEFNRKIEVAERNYNKMLDENKAASMVAMTRVELDAALRAREEFIKTNAKEDPIGSEIETRVELTNAQGIPGLNTTTEQKALAKSIDNGIKQYFDAPDKDLPIYSPGTDDLTTLRDLQEEGTIPEDAVYSSHGFSITPPNGLMGRVLQINYKSEEGNGSYIVPLDQTIKIEALSNHFNNSYMNTISEVARFENMQVQGMSRELPFTTEGGYSGHIQVDYKELSKPVVKFVMPGREEEAEYMNVYGDDFRNIVTKHEIRLM